MPYCSTCHNLVADDTRFCGRCGQPVGAQASPTDEPSRVADLSGQMFSGGRYLLVKQLGVGGMGTVYLANDTRLKRDVALKVLHAELVTHPTARRRMTQEAEALARIEHPNVVRMLDVFDEGPMLVMVLEFVTGGDLEGKIMPGGMPEADAVQLMTGILAGLGAIHEAGLVHRDMKPGNVLVTGKGVPKITDLGIARDSQAKEKTRLGAALGTPEYMSPEQVQGLVVDARCDIYSSGIVLYEMLTGHKPYDATSEFDIAAAHVREPPNLAALEGKVSAGVIEVVATALAKAPGDRFGSAKEMAEELAAPEVKADPAGGGRSDLSGSKPQAPAPAVEPSLAAVTEDVKGERPAEIQPRSAAALEPAPFEDAASVQANASRLWLFVAIGATVLAVIVVGPGHFLKKAEEPAPTAEVAAAAVGAPVGAVGAGVGAKNLNKAKALIDRMAGDFEKMTTEVEAAGSDQTMIKTIGDKFKARTEGMKSEGEALRKLLTEAENKELESYAKEKIAPLTGRLLAAMMKAQVAAQGAPAEPPSSK